jgi:glycosyltransferase involved in cell wall biosynthesis
MSGCMMPSRVHTRRLRVAHVSLGLDIGGQERLLVEFARLADRSRFELTFVSLSGRGALAPAIEAFGWPILALDEPPGLRPGMVLRLACLFRREGFDVIHTHDDKPLLYGAPAVKLARAHRFVHTHHHGLVPQITPRLRKLEAWLGRWTDAFVCVSQDGARAMEATGLPAEHIITLWNGIDLEEYPYQGPHPGGPAVTVARLSPEKDIATLLRAVALVAPTTPGFRLEIAGAGPLRAELVRLTSELGLADRVRFLGAVDDVPALLATASVFVLPSQTEGISLTILEAMARGLPVLATNVGGNPEVVLNGTTGLLVPAGDPAALAQGLVRLWSNRDDAQLMGRAGRRRAETYFDVRTMIARYERLYIHKELKSAEPVPEHAMVKNA